MVSDRVSEQGQRASEIAGDLFRREGAIFLEADFFPRNVFQDVEMQRVRTSWFVEP